MTNGAEYDTSGTSSFAMLQASKSGAAIIKLEIKISKIKENKL